MQKYTDRNTRLDSLKTLPISFAMYLLIAVTICLFKLVFISDINECAEPDDSPFQHRCDVNADCEDGDPDDVPGGYSCRL